MMAAASELRLKVVGLYRSLYRTRQELFHGDQVALTVSLQKLRHGFLENKNEADLEKIKNLIKLGEEVNYLLKHKTVQCQLNNTGNYEMKIRKDTTLLDNAVYPNDKR
ncbi:Complex III assembly factor LYRM7 [Trichoplax sp. H2]|nr:Complex III assembly factor LYRM7 [Trichoplax sp. H2]|eukprot:RDD39023.1 Complex III assembly factor LYRM7 [Trichoplax sp. H2]